MSLRPLKNLSTNRSRFASSLIALIVIISIASGCNLVPDVKRKPQYHNPFPQISKVAVMPFRNQSQEPTLSGARVSMAYYDELQSIRGFEVVPFGVVENQLAFFEQRVLGHLVGSSEDFQQFAKHLGVDAVLQGAITDYDPYYPPRMTLKVNWYAANAGFHPIPVGYGLPWGTKKEKKIPEWIRLESERSLAAEQMKSQSPINQPEPMTTKAEPMTAESNSKAERIARARIALPLQSSDAPEHTSTSKVVSASANELRDESSAYGQGISDEPEPIAALSESNFDVDGSNSEIASLSSSPLPANWPDPQGFIPARPKAQKPEMRVQYEPIISHMKAYNGSDEDFTHALGEYYYFRDDERFGGWQSYLQRSEDFIRFCCHLHIVETLGSRGGELESRMILRWPINRYER
jgi:hypothetical protein